MALRRVEGEAQQGSERREEGRLQDRTREARILRDPGPFGLRFGEGDRAGRDGARRPIVVATPAVRKLTAKKPLSH